MKYNPLVPFFILVAMLASCGKTPEQQNDVFAMDGVWVLGTITFPTGYTYSYPDDRGYTRCKIYDDSTLYSVELLSTGSETVLIPNEMTSYALIHDMSDTLLVENGRFMPHFCFVDDTTYTVYNNLEQETWVKVSDMSDHRKNEIMNIVRHNVNSREDATTNFVLSTSEGELRRTNHELLYMLVILFLLLVAFGYHLWSLFNKNRAIKQELQQIREENMLRPRPVAQAMKQVEQEFFQSEYYSFLKARIENGESLKPSDFEELEQLLRPVYPNFSSRLHYLCKMSAHEYQVCLLLKINISPSHIASALCKEVSSISSARSRLYGKVFGKKGSSKEWDAFIATL